MLSLGDAFTAAEEDLTRLSRLGYLSVVSVEHEALDDEELICALGILPVRCTSQDIRYRKLKPQSPRRISNPGGPHKKLVDGNEKPVPRHSAYATARSTRAGTSHRPVAPRVIYETRRARAEPK